MMDQFALDPYEQQLLKVFDSHDRDNCGSLDREGLSQLCQTLQLEEQGSELAKCLLKDKHSRATFTEFRDALLALLGNMQNNRNTKDSEKASPEREVSPKFVYGSKKYGRRSRPRNDETAPVSAENDPNLPNNNKSPNNASVQRSNSQTEVSSKKRKTNYKLKRCASLPGNDLINDEEKFTTSHTLISEPELIFSEEMLREAWRKLGVGEDGFLNQTELVLVCDAIGLQKLANGVLRRFSDKLSLNYDHKISFQELLEALQQDETWFEVLNQSPNNNTLLRNSTTKNGDNLFPDSRTFQFVTLGPDGNGIINTDVLIEMWETVGIHSPKELLHELGFDCRRINISDLAEVLEKHMKGASEATRSDYQSPHLTLLQANLGLYQSEIKCLKNVLEQLSAEREKLKCDVVEANNRATLLAQEVDDNHSKMEQNTLNHVRLIEQRHSEILRQVSEQCSKDKEQLTSINQTLEERIQNLEREVQKLKSDLIVARKYSSAVDKENQSLSGKIFDLEKDGEVLSNQIAVLENERLKCSELEREESELLLQKLSALQLENAQLKDRNDEMASEIENLSGQVANMRTKASSTPTRTYHTLDQSMEEENISAICEGVGLGAKRRSDYSPSKDVFGLADGSPRLGKVRKFYRAKNDTNAEVPFTSSESGFDTEVDCFDSSLSNSTSDVEELTRLQAKIAFLEQLLMQNNIPVPSNESTDQQTSIKENPIHLNSRIEKLERVIGEFRCEMRTLIETDQIDSDAFKKVSDKLNLDKTMDSFGIPDTVDATLQTDYCDSFEEKVEKLEKENKELTAKCDELENCVELLRNEYEKCEDYWQNKVDEERQMFESEQKVNSEKLADLIEKMKDYEDQYADIPLDNRLPTIEETYNLEKQFTDLEREFEDYKLQSENEIFRKDEEIAILKENLAEMALKRKQCAEAAIQVDSENEEERAWKKMQNFSSYVIENTNRTSDEMLPPQTNHNQSAVDQSLIWEQRNENSLKTESESSHSLPLNWNFNKANPSATNSSSSTLNSTPCRPKRTRKHDKNMYKKNNQDKEQKSEVKPQQNDWKGYTSIKANPEQTIVLPISSFHNLNGRKNFLEQRVRHLQVCIKQQHYCNEQTLQHYWQQFRGERSELHSKLKYLQEKLDQQLRIGNEQLDKLERTDLLVKDLYIENAYLIASVQRLEQQCHMLAQCSANSSSV